MKKKTVETLTIAAFLGFTGVFAVWNVFAPKSDYSANENRTLAKSPSLSVSHIFSGKFDDDFESWFSDHFVNRDSWIELKSALKVATGSIDNNQVYYAEDGHLIKQFQTYDHKTLQQNIDTINEFCESQNLKGNILLVPTASTAESQLLPWGSYDLDQLSMISSIKEQFSDQNFIDVADSLCGQDNLYYKTDHHWNEQGAYIGFQAIMNQVLHKDTPSFQYEKVSDSFYGTMYSKSGAFWTSPDSIYRITPENQDLEVTVTYDDGTVSDSLYSEKRLSEKDQYTYYVDGNHAEVKISTNANTGRKAVIVKDSYAHILIPYLATQYDEIDMIDLRYYHSPVSELIEDTQNTDLYFIYSLDNFAEDPNVVFLR